MSEANSQDASAYRFVKTPLEFFGHGPELYFDYPPAFYEEMTAAQAEAEASVQWVNEHRQELIETGDPKSYEYRRYVPDDQYQIELQHVRRKPTEDLKSTWYSRRMRGHYGDLVDKTEHPEATAYFSWRQQMQYNDPIGPPSPRPEAAKIAAYLNAEIANNAWTAAYDNAETWFNDLDDEHEDKQTARDYVAFSGGIILNEYCKTALAYADCDLGEDDFVSVKHLLTICWPKALQLEQFAPEEAAQKKRLLREIFLQFTLAGGDNVRNHASRLGYLPDETIDLDFERRGDHENAMLGRLMRFEDADQVDQAAVIADLEALSERLVAEDKWQYAINMLDIAQMAFALPREDIQKRIDEIAMKGVLALTNDMSAYDEQHVVQSRKEEYVTSNKTEFTGLVLNAAISSETTAKMHEVETTRSLEYQVREVVKRLDSPDRARLVFDFFDELQQAPAELVQRCADPEAVNAYVDLLCDPLMSKMYAQTFDNMIMEVIVLCNKGALSVEQQNQVLLSLADNLTSAIAAGPRDRDEFDRLIGYVSPILRGTKSQAVENSDDEMLWQFLPKTSFIKAMDALIADAERREDAREATWLIKQKVNFLADLRPSWNDFWKVRVEY